MASSSTRVASTTDSLDDATESVADWARLHAKTLAIGAIVLAAGVAGLAIYRSTESTRATRAEAAFLEAQAPLATRDLPAAERQLRQVATRYDGTAAGAQAHMLLAQVLFDQGKHQAGLDALAQADDAPDALRPSIRLLTAAGHEGLGKYADAARVYEQAAADVRGQSREQELRANAARAHQLAGNADAARRIWGELAKGAEGGIADEARVRLGELTTAPAAASAGRQ